MSDQAILDHADSLDIAIIGMAGRFPDASNIETFWRNLCQGVESIRRFSREELGAAGVPEAMLNLPNFVPAGTLLDDVELFDAGFFDYSPREAEIIDPQQRFFLESAWEALEHAGYDPARYPGLIGVFGGVSLNTYLLANVFGQYNSGIASDYFSVMTGSDKDLLATRVSYKLGLKGPSFTVQTACSTSLVAVHLACQSLLSYQSDMALAGGVSISVPQQQGYLYHEGGIASPDGHCRAFDATPSGPIKGDGVGIIVLKRLQDALADGDTIHALIKGTAINNDGARKIGFTAPSQDGQAEVLDAAYAAADVAPETIGYIEAHGTATPLGDPIEVAALTQVFRRSTAQKQFCAIGSVKTNVGHLDAAAGITGLIKAGMAVKHGQIPPTLHYTQPNPNIDFANSPFYVNNTLQKWDAGHERRRAGVSAFGVGGTNAHVVLEEAPAIAPAEASSAWHLLVLSAKSNAALDAATERLADHLAQHPDLDCADVAYTTQVGRQAFRYRRIAVCEDRADGERALRCLDPKYVFTGRSSAMAQPIVFMFPGGGAQYPRMGAELYETEPVFRAEIDRCAELLRPHLPEDLRSLLYSSADEHAAKAFERPSLGLPALFATEYALARQLMAWGIQPNAMIGHSLGEYVAACLAGVLRLEDALALVTLRGQLFEQLPVGGMMSVPLSEQELRAFLTPQLSVAAINGPQQCVVAGLTDDILALEASLTEQGMSCRRLPIAVAAHSPMVEPILRQFEAFIRTVPLQPPTMRYMSNVTGDWADPAEVTKPGYWVRHLRQTVRFGQSIDTLLQQRPAIFVEVGPGQTLSTLTRLQPAYTADQTVLPSLRHPHNQQPDRSFILTTLGRLWLSGVEIDWTALHVEHSRRRVPLPTYPFERRRFWIDRPHQAAQQNHVTGPQAVVPLWKQALLPPSADTPEAGWLVFTGGQRIGAETIGQLQQTYRDVVQVDAGAAFTELGPHHYGIDPSDPDSYRTLLNTLASRNIVVAKVLYLWELEATTDRAALCYLAQALHTAQPTQPVDVTVVSHDLHIVVGSETLAPERAAIIGPAAEMSRIAPVVRCRIVDIERGLLASPRLIAALIAEARAATTTSPIALRGRQRWVRESTPLPPVSEALPSLVAGGTYVVFDGDGEAGLAVAQDLARRAQARLVLIEPDTFPPCTQWTEWLAEHPESDPFSRKISAMEALLDQGVTLLSLSLDRADDRQLQAALQAAHAQLGPLHGVICADMIDLIAAQPAELAVENHAAMLQPLRILAAREQALQAIPFCTLLTTGGPANDEGAAWRIAAQQMVQAFAQQHNSRFDDRWFCVDWQGWHDHDQATEANTRYTAGIEMIWQALAYGGDAHVVNVTAPEREERAAEPEPASSTSQPTDYGRTDMQTPYVAPRTATEQTLAEVWTAVLGIDPIGVHDNFFELRGDSLLALQLVARLHERFQVAVPMRSMFETPTVAELAETIDALQGPAADRAPAVPASLVRLQPHGSKRPFFCMHPSGGIGACYAGLARLLDPDQPFYAVEALGVDGTQLPRTSIEDMARAYIQDIRTVQSEGPYLLGGWSMGGSIAFEMARQLQAEGQEVDLLVLIDTLATPTGKSPSEIDDVDLVATMLGDEMRLDRDLLLGHDTDTQLAILLEKAQAARILPQHFALEHFRRVIHTFRAHTQAWWDYRPGPYAGNLTVLKAEETTADEDLGWSEVTAADVELYVVPGNHQTLILPPHLEALAAQLSACLNAVQQPATVGNGW